MIFQIFKKLDEVKMILFILYLALAIRLLPWFLSGLITFHLSKKYCSSQPPFLFLIITFIGIGLTLNNLFSPIYRFFSTTGDSIAGKKDNILYPNTEERREKNWILKGGSKK
jgi:hypothetical protein